MDSSPYLPCGQHFNVAKRTPTVGSMRVNRALRRGVTVGFVLLQASALLPSVLRHGGHDRDRCPAGMPLPRRRRHPRSPHGAAARTPCPLPAHAREVIRTAAPTPGCMCSNRTGRPPSMAMQQNSVWRRNCPRRLRSTAGQWIEYGVAERAYALQRPDDFAAIVSRYGHTAVRPKQYTASAFIAGVLGVLSKHGTVLYHLGPATGRWKYNSTISWWAVSPSPCGTPAAYRGRTAAKTCPTYQVRSQTNS